MRHPTTAVLFIRIRLLVQNILRTLVHVSGQKGFRKEMSASTRKFVSAEDRDINELFDEIAFPEERLTQKSYEEGYIAGSLSGEEEGYYLGYTQGLQIGKELAEIYATAVLIQQKNTNTEKVKRTVEQLVEGVNTFPRHNDPEANIIALLERIRNLFKRLQSMLGLGLKVEKEDQKDYSF